MVTACSSPDVKDAMTKQGNTVNPSSPDVAARFFRTEIAKYARRLKKTGVELR